MKQEHCNNCIIPLGMSYPASYTCWKTCPCHKPSTLIEPKTCPECQFEQPRYLGEKSPHQKSCSKYERKPLVEMGEEKCECDRHQKPIYHVNDDPHSVQNVWFCPVHGTQKLTFLIHTEKLDYCVPCKTESSKVEQKDSWEEEFEKDLCEVRHNKNGKVLYWRNTSLQDPNMIPTPSEVKDFIRQEKEKSRKEDRERILNIIKEMRTNYPEDLFSEPPEGWQKDLDDWAKSKGFRIDNITAHFARWQEKIVKEDILSLTN